MHVFPGIKCITDVQELIIWIGFIQTSQLSWFHRVSHSFIAFPTVSR